MLHPIRHGAETLHINERLGCLDFDQHFAILNLQRIHSNLRARILLGRPSLHIPRPAMPGANNFAALNHSLPERSSAMQADVVHGAERAAHIGDADSLITAGKFFGYVDRLKFGFGGELGEVRHEFLDLALSGAEGAAVAT